MNSEILIDLNRQGDIKIDVRLEEETDPQVTPQATPQVTPQVAGLLNVLIPAHGKNYS